MKIFDTQHIQNTKTSMKKTSMSKRSDPLKQVVGMTTNGQRIVKKAAPPKDEASIRAKIAEKKAEIEEKNKPKAPSVEVNSEETTSRVKKENIEKSTKNSKEVNSVNEKAEEKLVKKTDPEVKKEIMLQSDIGNNNPNNEVTTEKLKGILKSGGFSFNQKEKAALAKILGKNK